MTRSAMHGSQPVERHSRPIWKGDRDARFYRNHLALPLAGALGVSVILISLRGDFRMADALYALQGHSWALKSNGFVEFIIHIGGRAASATAWLLVVVAYFKSRGDARLVRWRRPLAYLALTTLLAVVAVAAVKQISGMDCPWALTRYGGHNAFVGLFEQRPDGMPAASCFPAAHAGAGYAWVALYFFFLTTRPHLRWVGLGTALAAGAVLGFVQQLRGAHFMSHDVWALMLCWLVALTSHLAFHRNDRTDRRAAGQVTR